jgi:hypothetical protein
MVKVATVDTSGLQFLLRGLQNALIGSGGDVSHIVRDESKLLAVEISKRVGPRDRAKTGERIDKSVRSRFAELGEEQNNFEDNPGKEGHAFVKWYRCDENFLFGVARDLDMRHGDPETLAKAYFDSKTVQGRMRLIFSFHHPRQKQRVAITMKILTSKAVLRQTVAVVKKGIGRLKASWFATAKKIDPSLVGPEWVERHLKNNTTPRAITELGGLQNNESPSVEFGSKAAGAAKFSRVTEFAVKVRKEKVKARLALVLSGYSRDVARGIRVQRHAKDHAND